MSANFLLYTKVSNAKLGVSLGTSLYQRLKFIPDTRNILNKKRMHYFVSKYTFFVY